MLPDLGQFSRERGLAAVGVADLSILAEEKSSMSNLIPEDLVRAIVMGIRLEDAVVDQIEDRPTPLYFHLYRQANFALDRAALGLALEIQDRGYRALAVPASQIVNREERRGMVSHRMLGYAAGIGWIGRPTLLIHPAYGARMRYATVLTNAPYKPGEPLDRQCNKCRACIAVCPAGAIKESSRDFDVDACYDMLTEFRKLPFIGQHVCGICIKACRGPGCV